MGNASGVGLGVDNAPKEDGGAWCLTHDCFCWRGAELLSGGSTRAVGAWELVVGWGFVLTRVAVLVHDVWRGSFGQ